jgi:chemotaxis protein CheX
MPSELRTEDIEVLAKAVLEYFDISTGDKAQVRSAWLLDQSEPVLREDYNGLIEISGGYAGSICFSAPRRMLDFVLLASGDNDFSEAKYLDIVGEVANTLSGRARSYFGETLQISPPYAFNREAPAIAQRTHGTPFAIPIVWHGVEANLVVHLSRN